MIGPNAARDDVGDPVWWVLEHSRAKGSARLLLLVLAECANYRKCITFPSNKRLTLLTNLSRSQVYFHLRKLVDLGEIKDAGFAPSTGERVYHLVQFCERGKRNTVRFPGFSCPQTMMYERPAETVREPAYIEEREEESVREPGQRSSIPTEIPTKARGSNGHGRVRAARPTGAVPSPPGKYDGIKPAHVVTGA
jgi:hypothetical protein